MSKDHINKIAFGKAVRRFRVRVKMSQEDLAGEAGLDRTYIGGVERGERNPSLISLIKIAGGLRIRLSELFAEMQSFDGKGK